MMENPFFNDRADKLDPETINKYFIPHHNQLRFVDSDKNIFLVGERGSGKTMALLFYSIKNKILRNKINNESLDFRNIGIHVSCKFPIFLKNEYLLYGKGYQKSIINEHYFVLFLASSIITTLYSIDEIEKSFSKELNNKLIKEFEFILDINFNKSTSFLLGLKNFIKKELLQTQKKMNNSKDNEFYDSAYTFGTFILPLLEALKQNNLLKKSHFNFLIDDAHDLNTDQIGIMNSWISYRDNTDFSFKVSVARIKSQSTTTTNGALLLEGHDYIQIELEKGYYNEKNEYGKLAQQILEKRLELSEINTNLDNFFPEHQSFKEGIKKGEIEAQKEAEEKFKDIIDQKDFKKKVDDFVYKYGRARYYQSRSPKSNLPPYSGLNTIVALSTGVIRNLLAPCATMWDRMIDQDKKGVKFIPPEIQNKSIIQESIKLWDILLDDNKGLERKYDFCTKEQRIFLKYMFQNIFTLLQERLKKHESCPRAVVFYISSMDDHEFKKIEPLLTIAQEARLIYTRTGNAKDKGQKQTIYVLNRFLLPYRGLDVIGQHDKVGIKLKELLDATFKNKSIGFSQNDIIEQQETLF